MAAAAGGGGRRYALLLALRDSEYARKLYGGYYNVFVAALGGEGERWDSFRVVDGEFPAPEDLARYDGFVVSGSPHDAHGDDAWIRRLCALIRTVHAMKKRVLGICFGHQVLCRALGGRVGKACGGWDVGVRKVTFVQHPEGFEFHRDLEVERLPQSASIIEVHQDEVWEIPPRARVLAYSEKTSVEAFAVGEHALGIQGHPEYTTDILHNLIDRLTNENAIQRCVGEDARRTAAETGGPDRRFWTALCKGFLGGGGASSRPPHVPMRESPEVSSRAVIGCFAAAPMAPQLACSASTSIN
ncbi:gamma-glutamyl peptidase 3-like [Phragmites australis]|uniref:gamma-glutamyl peptidase 3-like n=1 Tax=Phragmites australis TaxID=29695 RepID=UPI002D7A3010|nr:gamma-glutamyl peptidase 3-like [Phragmites australis]